MRRSPAHVVTALLASAVLLVGCSSDEGDDAAGTGSTETAADTAGSAEGGTGGGGGGAGAGSGGAAAATAADPTSVLSGRVVPGEARVRTADLSVRVDDVRRAAEAATRLVTDAGGELTSEERSRAGDDGSAVLVLRVPPEAFDTSLTRLAELGDELDRRVTSADVGEQLVDLQSRLASQRASVERVRALLDSARNLGEVVQVEGELTRRTADLESLEARLAALEGQVALSTVTLRLSGEDGPAVAGGGPRDFGDGLAAGWSALLTVGRAAGVTAGALLPFLPVALAAGLVWRWRTRRTAPPPAAAGT